MIEYFTTTESGRLEKLTEATPGCWVAAFAPTDAEVLHMVETYGIDEEDLRAPLDPDEVSRLETDNAYSMIIVDTPVSDKTAHDAGFRTIPIAVFARGTQVVTVCREELIPLLNALYAERNLPRTQDADMFMLRILMASSSAYLSALRVISRARDELVGVKQGLSRKQLEDLYVLDESLVYFKTSLTTVDAVLRRNLRNSWRLSGEAHELAEDVVTENSQALETTRIFSEMLDSDIDHFGLLMDHDLNRTMQVVAVVALVMSVPTVIAGLFGMNLLGIPLADNPWGFTWITAGTLLFTILILVILKRLRWF